MDYLKSDLSYHRYLLTLADPYKHNTNHRILLNIYKFEYSTSDRKGRLISQGLNAMYFKAAVVMYKNTFQRHSFLSENIK